MTGKLEEFYETLTSLLKEEITQDVILYLNGYLAKEGYRITDHSYNVALMSIYMNKEKTALYIEILMITGLKILVMCKELPEDDSIHCIPFAYPPTSIISSAK